MSDVTELLDWLRGCLDEDERVARAAPAGPWAWNEDGNLISTVRSEDESSVLWGGGPDGGWINTETDGAAQLHIARWDPPRVLAEVAAKRDVLRHHSPVPAKKHPGFDCGWCGMAYPCFDALALAQPFAGRPGFRPEWTVTPGG